MPEHSEAFAPYAPLNVLKPVAQNVWVVDGPEIRMTNFGLGVPFPTRMTVVRLADGGLWLHSPIAPDEQLAERLEAEGPVRWLIAPSTLHYWWMPDWSARFPAARVLGAPGLSKAAKRPLRLDGALGDIGGPLEGEFGHVVVRSAFFTEVDFFHWPSRTLILTDLIENFEPSRVRHPAWRWILLQTGVADPDGKAPLDMQLSFIGRRAALRMAVERMIAWKPERIILAHGRWYSEHGVDELRRAFRWVL